ncbi:hypothetical protein ACGFIW_03125 [Micromonospora sp. NPDC048935]|uniref:hypothetical protein n=1 Tax=Micromonospora sp. NPDC048935 TaxID=3364262 RepID=UPI00371DB3F1
MRSGTSRPPVRRPPAASRPVRGTAVLLLTLVLLAGATPQPRRTLTVVPASRADKRGLVLATSVDAEEGVIETTAFDAETGQ